MRAEIASTHFHGNPQFTIADMPTHSLRGLSGGSGFADTGGHHGGSGGHHG